MPDSPVKTSLYEIVAKRADGACIWATLMPRRVRGDAIKVMFCNPKDVGYLKMDAARCRMATVLDKNGAAARLLPVTVGLDVSIESTSAAGDTVVVALPRPSPLRLPASHAALRPVIEGAIRDGRPVAFALSDSQTIIDAAPIERETAYAMLGMRPKR